MTGEGIGPGGIGPGDIDPEDLDRFDETLSEEGAAGGFDELPGGDLRVEVLRQRLADALLRSAAELRDVAGREGRIRGILDAVAAAGEIDLGQVDETLDDSLEVDELPAGEVRDEVVRQRVAHALLTAAHEPAAAVAHERRVRRIVDAAAGPSEAGGRMLEFPRRWGRLVAAAAVLIAATLAVRSMFGGGIPDPRLEAASVEMGRGIDRRFELMVERIDTPTREEIGVHDMWFHPLEDGGLRFRLHLDGERSGRQEYGCDGIEVWRRNLEEESDREHVRLADANEMFRRQQARAGRHREIDDPDHFDIRKLLELLAGSGVARCEGEPTTDADGHSIYIYYAPFVDHVDFGRLSSVVVRLDADDHVIEVLEFVRADADGVMRYRFEYRGVDPQSEGFYRQPW